MVHGLTDFKTVRTLRTMTTETPHITAIKELGETLYGKSWRRKLAEAAYVSERWIREWEERDGLVVR